MALFGKLDFYIADPTTGAAVSGVSIEIRKQGARANGTTGPTTVTVHSPGGIIVGDTVRESTDGESNAISAVTATTIVTGGAGWGSVPDNTRMTPTSNLPTIYEDDLGSSSKSNPLTTDANGHAECYVRGGMYDALVSGGGLTTTLLTDLVSTGGGDFITHIFGSGAGSAAWKLDTSRALTGTDDILVLANNGTAKFNFRQDGRLTLAENLIAVSATLSSSLVVGSAAFTNLGMDLSAASATWRIIPGATSFSVRNTGDTRDNLLIVDAGDITVYRDSNVRRIAASRGTALVAGDFSLHANWGTTASVATVETGSTDTRGGIRVTSAGTGQGAGPTVTLTFKDGTFTSAPFVMLVPGTNYTDLENIMWRSGSTATTATFQYVGTPVAGKTYQIFWQIIK